MDVVHPRCAGIAVSKRDAKVCVRVPGAGRARATSTVTTWGSVTKQILALPSPSLRMREHLTVGVGGPSGRLTGRIHFGELLGPFALWAFAGWAVFRSAEGGSHSADATALVLWVAIEALGAVVLATIALVSVTISDQVTVRNFLTTRSFGPGEIVGSARKAGPGL